jgi:hypothetical protein
MPPQRVASAMPFDAVGQAQGKAWALRTQDLRRENRGTGVLATALLHYSQAIVIHAMQTAACNKVHSIRQQTVLWILTMHDRANAQTSNDDIDSGRYTLHSMIPLVI